jgi:hypothetical protein
MASLSLLETESLQLAKVTNEFPGYRRSSGVDSVRADGTLPADRAVLPKD